MNAPAVLDTSEHPLHTAHDLALLDLDGVVYVGPEAVPGVAGHLSRAREEGMRLAYVTNNASRPPRLVAAHLRDLGIDVADDDVVTSAQAAARLLAEELPTGSRVFVIGGEGLVEALAAAGLEAVVDPADDPVAVVSGYHPALPWQRVIVGSILVRRGLPWVASNTDATVPTPWGAGPGNGVLVGVVAEFAGVEPRVAGKPEPPLFRETLRRVEGENPLVIGDRLDTDIEGARRAGLPSLLVMTGVTGPAELAAARPHQRPTYVGATLACLAEPHTRPHRHEGTWQHGGWTASVRDGEAVVEGDGAADHWWQVLAAATWDHLDTTGEPAGVAGLTSPDAHG